MSQITRYSEIENINTNVSDIETQTNKIPDIQTTVNEIEADTDLIKPETDKIDTAIANGLTGVRGSVAYITEESENHVHSYERWYEKATTPNAQLHLADRIGSGSGSFQIDAGNNDWGAWVQVVGSQDTPFIPGMVMFDFHRILVTATERNALYFIQIAYGATAAAAFSANEYTEFPYNPASASQRISPLSIQGERQMAGVKVWARCKCPAQNTGTLDFIFGLHEYEG